MATASHKEPPPPCAIVIFGANGDLTKRLIVPALYNLARTGLLPQRLALVGVDHNHKTAEELQAALHDFLAESLKKAAMTPRGGSTSCGSPSPRRSRFCQGRFRG